MRDELPDIDTVTALMLGDALYRFMARANDESEMDEFSFEDAGLSIQSGFIEIDPEAMFRLSPLIEAAFDSAPSGGAA